MVSFYGLKMEESQILSKIILQTFYVLIRTLSEVSLRI